MFASRFVDMLALEKLQASYETTSGVLRKNDIINVAAFGRKDADRPLKLQMMGVPDIFGESGEPWELMKAFGLTAEHIAKKALAMLGRK